MIGESKDFSRRLLKWFGKYRRDLPWRLPLGVAAGPRELDSYFVLVSEAMLQQTQVTTVIPYFNRFVALFPTVQSLASADQQQVLRAWQGLGYYSRARNLQRAAQAIVADFAGTVPGTVEDLLKLPGVGRYTAGAVASIAFENRAPILDGNVARVLCRIDAVQSDPREKPTRDGLWKRAEEILPRRQVGHFNSALMELGALVCTPRGPQCLLCPVRVHCQANAAGIQDRIPPPKVRSITPMFKRWTFCIRDGEKYLVQQRSEKGRWASMLQFFTIEPIDKAPSSDLLRLHYKLHTTEPIRLGTVEHSLTHRRYRFDVFSCQSTGDNDGDWLTLAELDQRPMPRPHLKIILILAASQS